jgi:hypothetical protein
MLLRAFSVVAGPPALFYHNIAYNNTSLPPSKPHTPLGFPLHTVIYIGNTTYIMATHYLLSTLSL